MPLKKLKLTSTEVHVVKSILRNFLGTEGYEVIIFGSRAGGNPRADSDLDIAVKSSHPLTAGKLSELRAVFEESSLPFKVDIVDYRNASEAFQEVINSSGCVSFKYTD